MKLPKKQTSRKKIIVIAVLALLVVSALAFGGWYFWNRNTSSTKTTINYSAPTAEEKSVGDQQKERIVAEQNSTTTTTASPVINPQILIVRTFQDPTGFNMRTQINGTTSGECDITLSKSGQPTITKVFPITFDATTASCQNTPIATSEFPQAGTWQLSVIAKNGAAQSTAATQSVEIKK